MGKGNKKNKGRRRDHSGIGDTESIISSCNAMSDFTSVCITEDDTYDHSFVLDKLIDDLYEKRSLTRESALEGLVDAFERSVLLPFVEDKCDTLSHLFINSIKKGSAKETILASRAIGLLSLTIGGGTSSYEIMEEALPLLCRILSRSDQSKIPAVLKCLALVTFLGGNDLDETQEALKAIWKVIRPKSGYNVETVNYEPPVVVAAITAWSCLLTRIGRNSMNWTEHISHLSTLLEANDRTVRMAAGEAIALFFERNLFDVQLAEEHPEYHQQFTFMQDMKAKVMSQIDILSCEARGKGVNKKNLNDQRELFQKIWNSVMDDSIPEEAVKISSRSGTILTVSSWTELIQLNFLRHFLQKGFLKHAQDNPLMREMFYLFVDKKEGLPKCAKKIHRSESGRKQTRLLKQDRQIAEARKQSFFHDLMY